MTARSLGVTRLLGVFFVVVMVAGVALAVAIYQKRFSSVVLVQLRADQVGNQLLRESDVRMRGVRVGEVRDVSFAEGQATVQLAFEPDMAKLIPSNATARFLPKTLFGDKYVDLLSVPSAVRPIADGDIIHQDTTATTVEISRLLDDLLPLLRAVPPQQLGWTLGTLSQALDGRGAQLGENLSQLNTLVSSLNGQLPALKADISGLADFATTYRDAAPSLLTALATLTTTSNTVVDQRSQLTSLLTTLTTTSANLTGFLNANGANLIRLSNDSTTTVELFARYAPDYQCMLANLANLVPRVDAAVGAGTNRPALRLKIEFVKSRGKYLPDQDEPKGKGDPRGPRCYPVLDPLAHPGVPNYPQYPGGPVADGSTHPPSSYPDFVPGTVPPQPGYNRLTNDLGLAGSRTEQTMLSTIISQTTGAEPGQTADWSALVAAPALRGRDITLN